MYVVKSLNPQQPTWHSSLWAIAFDIPSVRYGRKSGHSNVRELSNEALSANKSDMTRIERLEQAISNLAANADEQHAYLESILAPVSGCNDGRGYGNDELGLEFDDIFIAVDDMVYCSELSKDQLQATKLMDEHLGKLWGEQNADFWVRDALWHDPRWQEVRDLAKKVRMAFVKN